MYFGGILDGIQKGVGVFNFYRGSAHVIATSYTYGSRYLPGEFLRWMLLWGFQRMTFLHEWRACSDISPVGSCRALDLRSPNRELPSLQRSAQILGGRVLGGRYKVGFL